MSRRSRRPLPGVTTVYTSWPVRFVMMFVGGLAAGLPGTAVMAVVDGSRLEDVTFAGYLLLIALGVWRGVTVRVVEDRDGLVVRNVFRTARVRWSDVVRVTECEVRLLSDKNSYRCPCLVVRGRQYRVKCVAMTDFGDHRFAAVAKAWRR